MSYFDTTYADHVLPILSDWLTNSRIGKAVANLPLSLANRAQESLWAKKAWSFLEVVVDVVPDSDNAYVLPVDVGKIIIVGEYSGTDLLYEYKEGNSASYGYILNANFTKESGHQRVLTFNSLQGNSIKMTYKKTLPNFIGQGVEYSFFPANLLLLQCQMTNTSEKGNSKEWQMQSVIFKEAFDDFVKNTLYVNADTRPVLRDRAGNNVVTPNYSLSGNAPTNPSPYSNKRIGGCGV